MLPGQAGALANRAGAMSALAHALISELSERDLDRLAELLAPRLAVRLRSHSSADGWLTTRAAAEYLGLSIHGLHRLTAQRAVPFHQDAPGARCWFRRAELDEWRRAGGAAHERLGAV